jgi:hypothetical protein
MQAPIASPSARTSVTNDVPIEKSADLVGHRSTIVAQQLYRHQLRPVIETGATTMNTIFKSSEEPWVCLTSGSLFGL